MLIGVLADADLSQIRAIPFRIVACLGKSSACYVWWPLKVFFFRPGGSFLVYTVSHPFLSSNLQYTNMGQIFMRIHGLLYTFHWEYSRTLSLLLNVKISSELKNIHMHCCFLKDGAASWRQWTKLNANIFISFYIRL